MEVQAPEMVLINPGLLLLNNQGQDVGGGAKLTFSFPLNNNLAKGNYSIQ